MGLTLFGTSVWAQETLRPLIPTLHPNCSLILDSSGLQTSMSQDCSTVFLEPPALGEVYYEVFTNGNVRSCSELRMARDSKNVLSLEYSKLQEQYIQAVIDKNEKNIKIFIDNMKVLTDMEAVQDEKIARLAVLEGAVVKASYVNTITEGHIDNFVLANHKIFQNEGFIPQIRKANIEDSIYSFNYISEAVDSSLPVIKSTTIPGLEMLTQTGGAQKDVAHVQAGDVVSGQITLSLNGVCNFLEKSKAREITARDLGALLVVNRNYKVPSISSYGYTASLNALSITKAIGEKIKSGSYNGIRRSDVYDMAFSELHQAAFKMTYTEGHVPDDEAKKQMLQLDVYGRLFDQYMTSLENSGFLKFQAYEDVPVSDGGTVIVQVPGRVCSRKWYGSKSCRDTVFDVKQWVDGYAHSQIDESKDFESIFTEQVSINEIVSKQASSIF